MSDEPRVSIIVPAFQAERTLGKVLASILPHIDMLVDVMVVDDGSTDDTKAEADRFSNIAKCISTENRGVSHARNLGISKTSGEWIVFLDADDLLLEGTIAKRLQAADSAGADAVVCDWQELFDNDSEPHEELGEVRSLAWEELRNDAEIACATNVWAPPAAIMYRRTLVEKIGGFREDLPVIQDARFLFDAAYNGARFVHSDHVGAQYRIRRESLSRRNESQFWKDVFTNGKQIEALWRNRGVLDPPQRRALANIYDQAARGLFDFGQPEYFEAVDRLRHLGGKLARHPRFVAPLARAFGLHGAKRILKLLGR